MRVRVGMAGLKDCMTLDMVISMVHNPCSGDSGVCHMAAVLWFT